MQVYNAKLIKIFNASSTVYIGRKHPRFGEGSVLANPFKIGKHGDRDQVVEAYRWWLWGKIKEKDESIVAELHRIGELELSVVCWCAPLACHGDIVIGAAKWITGVQNEGIELDSF